VPYRRAALLAAGAALLGAGCPRPPLPPNELPTAVLVAPAEVDAGALADFDASMSSDPDGRLVEYWFNFGDGTPRLTTSDPRTVHGYAQPGVYGVALTVIDDRGGRSDTFGEIVVTGEILPPPPQCFDDSDCDAADVCVDGACQPVTPGCDGPEDCAPGEICMDGTCVPSSGFLPCVREADCAPGEACQLIVVGVGLFATECRPEQAGGAALGEPCAVPTSAIGCATPPSGPTFCRTGLCVAGTCTQICEALADCPSAYQCIDLRKIALGDVGAFHGCVSDPVVDTDSATVAALALGFFAPSPPFIVAPPLDAVSMTLVTSDIGSDRTVTLFDLTAPSGLVLWDLIGFAGGFPQPLLQLPLWEVSTALLPNTPSLQLCPGGDYTARFTADMAVDGVALNRIFKTADGPVGGGRLDLNLFFVGTMADPNAATAPGDSAFQSELAYAEEILQQAGISLGAVSYFDLTGPQADALQIINSVVGPTAELADLLALSSAAPNGALNVFFVSMIDDPMAAGTIGGVSGGIPGPPGFAGSTHSGIALSLAPFPTFTGALGQELAHETAHYLGLFHTTEPDGTTFESIPDTPVCDVSFDANGDGVLLASECGAAGATNLMFWAQSTPYNIEVTPGQGFVLVRHPDVGGL
jgi:PKD repeat protein